MLPAPSIPIRRVSMRSLLSPKQALQLFDESLLLRLYVLSELMPQLLDQLARPLIELGRHFHADLDELIPAPPAHPMRNPLAAHAQNRTGLCGRRNPQLDLAVQRGNLDLAAQGRPSEGDRYAADHVISDPP